MGSASPAPLGVSSRGKEGSRGDGRNTDSTEESTDTEEMMVRRWPAAARALQGSGSGCSPGFPFADEGPHLGPRGEPVVGMPEPRSSCPISASLWRLPAGARLLPSSSCTHIPTTSASSPVPCVGQLW